MQRVCHGQEVDDGSTDPELRQENAVAPRNHLTENGSTVDKIVTVMAREPSVTTPDQGSNSRCAKG
ncbi:hypothetical protein ACFPRL_06435 [Pseudoclavibacter helvolus]